MVISPSIRWGSKKVGAFRPSEANASSSAVRPPLLPAYSRPGECVVPVAAPDEALAWEAVQQGVQDAGGLVDVAALAPRLAAAAAPREDRARERPAA